MADYGVESRESALTSTHKLWFLLNKPSQERLRKLMPKGWKPPRRGSQKVRVEGKIEDIEELEKIMQEVPRGK